MTGKPRPPVESLFSGPTFIRSMVLGALVLGLTGTIFVLAPG